MTDRLPPLATHIVPPSQSVYSAPASVSVYEPPELKKQETADDEEHNTIKCICGFSDDDGQTIFCETCLTWQHIACYYPGHIDDALREDFAHSCIDCRPRPVDAQKAHEIQKARLATSVVEQISDRKPRRPPSKSHKKKPKPNEIQLQHGTSLNNVEHTKHSLPHDHSHSHKKTKSSHKASHSVSAQAPKRSPSNGTLKTAVARPPSPATTPPVLARSFQPIPFSADFSTAHDDRDVKIVDVNSYKGLEIPNTMSRWLRDEHAMRSETGCGFEVFHKMIPDMEQRRRFPPVERKETRIDTPDGEFHRSYLAALSTIDKDAPLMELNGQIGFQREYTDFEAHRWAELSTPLPYVFFHPMLPLYIDTRKEGSQARYVRRSCHPNSAIELCISDGSEYHFWLMSERAVTAGEQITIPWDFRFPVEERPRLLHHLGLGEQDPNTDPPPDLDDQEYENTLHMINNVLSEYGGCACNLGPDCAFFRFHQTYMSKHAPRANPTKKKSRKPKVPNALSPTSTGHATNSRAASEGRFEDGADHEVRSQSGSSRSKPPSRDMTPARQGSFDTLGILTEPTDRDKRKVAMVEDSFRRMEQQQPPRKKKRLSDGTGPSTSRAKSVSKGTGSHALVERRYVDAGTSRSKSGSPAATASPRTMGVVRNASSRHASAAVGSRHASESPRPNYCDAAVQTDPVEGEWYSGIQATAKPKKRVISLSKRLLNSRHQSRLGEEERRKQFALQGSTTPMDVDSPTLAQGTFAYPLSSTVAGKHGDVTSTSLGVRDGQGLGADIGGAIPLKHKMPDLRVQMPPVPTFSSSTSYLSSGQTPLSATSPMVQSPFASHSLTSPFGAGFANGLIATASPVKKKMSLSDYKSRMNKGQAGKPSVSTVSLKTSVSNADEPKSASSLDTPGTVKSPTVDKITESHGQSNGAPPSSATVNGGP